MNLLCLLCIAFLLTPFNVCAFDLNKDLDKGLAAFAIGLKVYDEVEKNKNDSIQQKLNEAQLNGNKEKSRAEDLLSKSVQSEHESNQVTQLQTALADLNNVLSEKDPDVINTATSNLRQRSNEFEVKLNEANQLADRIAKNEETEKQNRIVSASKNNSFSVSELYKNSVKPKHFKQMKNAVSFLQNWKVEVNFDPETGYADYSNTFDYMNPFSTMAESTDRVLVSPPLAVEASEEKPMIIASSVTKKLNQKYIISSLSPNPQFEAIANIPKEILGTSGIGFKDPCFIVCNLTGVEEASTLFGGTKTVSVINVLGIIPWAKSDKFIEYILGNPDQFPPQQYVNLTTK